MPYYQCPRCGGNDSYGQWEQRFHNQNITFRDNQNRQVGSSNGGFGVSNIRQQYCRSCMSVKMDLKFTTQDFKVVGVIALILVGLSSLTTLFAYLGSYFNQISENPKQVSFIENFVQQPSIYYLASSSFLFLGIIGMYIFRKIWIKREDRKFLRDRFYKPRPPRSKKFQYGWLVGFYLVLNIVYLLYVN